MALVGLVSGTAGAAVPAPMAPVIGWMAIRPETTLVAPTVLANAGAAFEPTTVLPVEVRPVVALPAAPVIVETVTTTTVMAPSTDRSLRAMASWYCRAGVSPCMTIHPDTAGFDAYAAAGPRLRAAICGVQSCTSWRGRIVTVNGVRVRLSDWCQCGWHQSWEKAIDLYYDVWLRAAKPTGGRVVIRW